MLLVRGVLLGDGRRGRELGRHFNVCVGEVWWLGMGRADGPHKSREVLYYHWE